MTKVVANPKEIAQIYTALENVLTKDKDGFWKYKPGWTDQRLVESTCPRLDWHHVQTIRIKSFGASKGWSKDRKEGKKDDRLGALEKEVAKLRAICAKVAFEFGIKVD